MYNKLRLILVLIMSQCNATPKYHIVLMTYWYVPGTGRMEDARYRGQPHGSVCVTFQNDPYHKNNPYHDNISFHLKHVNVSVYFRLYFGGGFHTLTYH